MSTPAEDLAAAMRVQSRDQFWLGFWLGVPFALLLAFIAVMAGFALGGWL